MPRRNLQRTARLWRPTIPLILAGLLALLPRSAHSGLESIAPEYGNAPAPSHDLAWWTAECASRSIPGAMAYDKLIVDPISTPLDALQGGLWVCAAFLSSTNTWTGGILYRISALCPAATPPYTYKLNNQRCERCVAPFAFNASNQCVCAFSADGGAPPLCDDGNPCTTDGCNDSTGCTHSALSCDDGNACTTDSCNPDAGTCMHATTSCDDGKSCTEDSCSPDAGCAHTLDAGACTCAAGTPVTVPVGGSKQFTLADVSCPVGLAGTLGTKLTLSAAGTFEKDSCANGCTSSGALQGSSELELSLCTGNKVVVTATGRYTLDKKFNPECSPATCGSGCGAGYCRTDEASGSLTAAQSRFLGKNWKEPFPGGQVFLKCGGTLSGSLDVGGGLKHVTSAGAAAGTCTECQAGSLSVTGTLGASFNCTSGIEYRSMVREVGCQKCLIGEVKVTGGQIGSCGAPSCYGLGASAKISGDLPAAKMGFKWFSVTGVCGFATTGCSEVNTCGACTCGGATCSELSAKFSCSVCYGNSALPACKRTL